MGKFSEANLFGMTIRESATDGSDFTNPDADYRRLFLGEDGNLHLKDSAGAVTDVGGGAPTSAKFVTTAIDATLSAEVVIPGLAASPDIRVAGANDDEFDTTDTTDPMTGWTTLGTPTNHNINSTALSHYRVQQNATASVDLVGIYKAIPATPFTVTCKLTDVISRGDFNSAGLLLGEAAPGKLETLDLLHDGTPDNLQVDAWTNRTTYASTPTDLGRVGGPPIWMRCIVTTTTNIAWYYSLNGLAWRTIVTGRNPGFTVGVVGLYGKSHNATYGGEAFFDWIRFT